MRSSDTWVCVADGARARFFRCDGPCQDLEPVIGFGMPDCGAAFAGRLAGQLDRAARDHLYQHLVLVGPQAVLADVADCLKPETLTRLTGAVDKDLCRATPKELTTHLCEYLPH